MKLTKTSIERVCYDREPVTRANGAVDYPRCVVWDDELPGFGVRIYPTGRKAFLILYRVGGRQRQMVLGTFGVLTLPEARQLARKRLVEVADGADPLQAKKRREKGDSFADLAQAYMTRYAKPHKKSWIDDERRINRYLLPRWGSWRADSITYEDVAQLHHDLAETPYQANRTVALISVMFAKGSRWGLLPKAFDNPAKGIDNYREHKRDRWVRPEEIPRLAQAIDEEPDQYARGALWLYLLTGLRKTELLATRWDDVDLHRLELRLPDTKAGRAHYLPISPPAAVILKALPRLASNPYVFPGKAEGSHREDFRKPWARVRAKAGVDDVRLHDLRRTLGSWLAQSGNSLHLIGRVLNHSNQSTTAVYARFATDHVRSALDQHGEQLLGAAGLKPAAEVVPIKKKK